ncbi:DUF1203 domain-containing protein [Sphingorhabdus sp. YGSMI21]|uniref:DUF1203 domain-containing protein n=1 Tax=Sphingorhabdus sp. YGSMI21 TaxID=2077182 RepID=UPI000F4F9301|nr:DUF1203 domain-containing protein [Sphingorhabdus sp. YGSMI21]
MTCKMTGLNLHIARSLPGEADRAIRQLFELDELAYIDVHNATYGCFVARVERFES